MRALQLLLLCTTLLTARTATDESCSSEFDKHAHPRSCCKYPMNQGDGTDIKECFKECKDRNFCCIIECVARKLKYYENGVFQPGHLYNAFIASLKRDEATKWQDILNSTLIKCLEIVPQVKTSEDECKEIPDFVPVIVACMLKYNFIECPTMKDSSECQETVEYVRNAETACVVKSGNEKFINRGFYIGFKN